MTERASGSGPGPGDGSAARRTRTGVRRSVPWALLVVTAMAGCGSSFEPGYAGAGGTGGSGTTSSTSSTSGTTTSSATTADWGCSDREREGLDGASNIAACAGGFSEPGLAAAPSCSRLGGDDSTNPNGTGCSAADLCAPGWHVCASAGEVEARLASATDCAALTGGFFATLVATTPAGLCEDGGIGGVAGCGDLGDAAFAVSCQPLSTILTGAAFDDSNIWACQIANPLATATKLDPGEGGVLCCR